MPHLAEHQQRLLDLIAAGHVTKQIATQLGVSIRTVYIHQKMLLDTLGATNKIELVARATELGLLQYREIPLNSPGAHE